MSYRMTRLNPLGGRAVVAAVLAAASLACLGGLVAVGSAQAAPLPTLTLSLTSSSITVAGTPQSGAVDVVVSASGVKEASAILFLLKPGVSVAEVETFLQNKKLASDPNNATKFGTIVFDAEAAPAPGTEAQTDLQPGQYLALLAPNEGSPKIHAAFTVAASKAPATLPTPEATVRSIEFNFRGPTTLHDGELVRFENEGFLVHMDIAFPVKNAKAAKKVMKALLDGKEKGIEKLVAGPPIELAGPLSPGSFQQETINARPGVYVQACFMETQDGRVHTRLGMERMFKITK
jgi:hypothetical protein